MVRMRDRERGSGVAAGEKLTVSYRTPIVMLPYLSIEWQYRRAKGCIAVAESPQAGPSTSATSATDVQMGEKRSDFSIVLQSTESSKG